MKYKEGDILILKHYKEYKATNIIRKLKIEKL